MRFGELILFFIFLLIVIVNIIARAVRAGLKNRKSKKPFEKEISERGPEKVQVKPDVIDFFSEIQKKIHKPPEGELYDEHLTVETSEEIEEQKTGEVEEVNIHKAESPFRGKDLLSTTEKEEISIKETAWERINRLSLLRKAVVLSEILGKPRGLD